MPSKLLYIPLPRRQARAPQIHHHKHQPREHCSIHWHSHSSGRRQEWEREIDEALGGIVRAEQRVEEGSRGEGVLFEGGEIDVSVMLDSRAEEEEDYPEEGL